MAIAAYLLIALFMVIGGVHERAARRLGERAVEADAGRLPIEEVVRDTASFNAATIHFAINPVILTAIILDMGLKPFKLPRRAQVTVASTPPIRLG